jgi:hypothetical protein
MRSAWSQNRSAILSEALTHFPGPFFAVNPVDPSGLRGYTGRDLLPPHFKGIGRGAGQGLSGLRLLPSPVSC